MALSIFTGCGGSKDSGGSSDAEQGSDAYLKRYDLTEIEDIESVLCMDKYGDSYIVLGQDGNGKLVSYTSSDGLTWNDAELWQPEDGSYITAADVSAAGKAIMAVSGASISLMSLDIPTESDTTSGVSEPTEITSISATSISDVRFSADGSTFYIGTESGVTGCDMSGKKTIDIQLEGLLDFCDTEDGLLVLAEDSLGVYSTNDGRLTKEYKGVADALTSQLTDTASAMGKDALSVRRIMKCDGQTAYMALEDGLYKADLTSDVAIKISGDDYKISNEVLYDYVTDDTSGEEMVTAVVCNLTSGSSKLAVGYSMSELQTNMNYFEKNASSDNTDESASDIATTEIYTDEEPGTITVYSLRYALFMDEIIQAYEKKHPNIQVEYRYGVSSENGVTVSDAIKALNTELLSGGGPDVLIMDGLNIDDYADSGVLMELSDVYDEILDKNPNCLEKVMSAYRQDDGGIYAIPSKVQFSVIVASEDDIDSLNTVPDITDYIKSHDAPKIDINALNIYEWEILYDILYPGYSVDIIKSDGSYDAEALRTFLIDIKGVWDALLDQTSDTAMEKWKEEVADDQYARDSMGYMHPLYNREYSGQSISISNWKMIMHPERFYSIKHNQDSDNENYTYKVLTNNSKNIYEPTMIFGINSSSPDQDSAKSFVREMYSTDLQMVFPVMDADYRVGLYVNLDTVQAYNDYMLTLGPCPGSGGKYGGLDTVGDYFFSKDVDMSEFSEILSSLDTPADNNMEIRNMIEEMMADYMSGSESLDDCMNDIGDSLDIYLNE